MTTATATAAEKVTREAVKMTASAFCVKLTAELASRAASDRSAWARGVAAYAEDLAENLTEALRDGYTAAEKLTTSSAVQTELLNGAQDWEQFSWGGSALIYDGDIAERLCTPSELKRTRGGERRPNAREEWLDTQARALYQAARRVTQAVLRITRPTD